ncbi:MAG: hypothetical protein GY711_21825 [bacterium]|nr:hypothetical protein [bacterium]
MPILLLLLLAAPLAAAAQDPVPEPAPPEKLDAWPAVENKEQVATDIKRLRKAATEAMAQEAHTGLIAAGAGVAPALLRILPKERDEDAQKRITAVLDSVVGEAHTRLLGEYFASKKAPVRRWALARAAPYRDAGLRESAENALAAARAGLERKKMEDEDVYLAALLATSTGSLLGLDPLFARARKRWGDHKSELRSALEAVRGEAATKAVVTKLSGKRDDKIAALRMLAGCGDSSAIAHTRKFLDDTDNGLRIATINMLRGVVDGEPPIDRLPVFEAIELAQKWKARL